MRPLPLALEDKFKLGVRQPAYKVYAYDTKVDTLSSIVLGTNTQGPLDLTDLIQGDIQWSLSTLSFTMSDPDGRFHGDSGSLRNYIEDGCCIRLKEGDTRVSEEAWVWTFTGTIKGQVGWQKGPRKNMIICKVQAFNRDSTQAYKRRKITTREYTDGTDIGIMLHDICNKFMGLNDQEIMIPLNTGRVFMHKINQLSMVAPWDGINTISEVVSCVPFFTGDGRLSWWSKNLSRNPDRVLPDYVKVARLEMTPRTGDVVNKVKVIFLDSIMEKVPGKTQCLGKAEITTGFFTFGETLECWWSDDRKQRAENTFWVIKKSINANLFPVGTEEYEVKDDYHGVIIIEVSPLYTILAMTLVAAYVAAAFIPDGVATGGLLFSAGQTIPYGRIIQAFAMVSILTMLMCLGSAQYEVWGDPFDMAYVEKRSIAIENGIPYWDEIEKEIKNDFIGSYDQADTIALAELIFEKSSGLPRTLIIDDDLTLEMGDIIQIPDGRQVFVLDMKKTIKRGQVSLLEVNGFKVRTST